jgi:hypothetical protein
MLFSIYGRSRSPLALIVSGCISSILVLHFLYASEILPGTRPKAIDPATLLARQSTFWRSFYPDLVKFGPNCDALTHPEDTHLNVPYDASDTNRTRPDRLSMSASQVLQLRATHTSLTTQLKSKDYILPYLQKSRGIVTTAGGSHLPVAVLSIRMLRRTGSELPVEVFLASQEEWDPQICDVVFLAMNARCVVLQDIFDAAGDDKSLRIGKDQYKIMSIVFSSFEEVLFMDSDCFPVFDPSEIFDSEPFQSTSLILWPDFWFPSESRSFLKSLRFPHQQFITARPLSPARFSTQRRNTRILCYLPCTTIIMALTFTILYNPMALLGKVTRKLSYGQLLYLTNPCTLLGRE